MSVSDSFILGLVLGGCFAITVRRTIRNWVASYIRRVRRRHRLKAGLEIEESKSSATVIPIFRNKKTDDWFFKSNQE